MIYLRAALSIVVLKHWKQDLKNILDCRFAAAFSPLVTFTAEFCHSDVRDRVLLFQASYQSLSLIVLATISWAVLTQDWKTSLFGGHIG